MIRTKTNIITKKESYCKNAFTQTKGLMFSQKKILVFIWKSEKLRPIHMFFVFFPIDLFYLNKNREIIEIKKNVKPFGFYNPKKKAQYLIEAPLNLLSLKVKDVLKFN